MVGIPDIKFKIVAGGQDQVKSALKTIEQSITAHQRTVQNLLKSSLSQQTKLYQEAGREQEHAVKASHTRIEELYANMARRQANLAKHGGDQEVSEAKKTTHALEREMHRRNTVLNSGIRGTLQSFGLSRVGGGLQAGQAFGGGTTGIAGSAGGMLLGVGIAAAGYAVYKAFDMLTNIISSAVTTFASAIVEIGGGFTVGGAIVKAAKNQTSTLDLSHSLLDPSQRMSVSEINAGMPKGSMFKREEWINAARVWAGKTGSMRDFFAPENTKFMEMVSANRGVSLSDLSMQMANTKAQFGNMSSKDLQAFVLSQVGIGAAGTAEFKDITRMAPAFGIAPKLAGDLSGNLGTISSIVERAIPGMGGDVSEAVTGTKRVNQIIQNLNSAQAAALGIKYDKNGQITNYEHIIASLAANYMNPKTLQNVPKEFRSREAGALLNALGGAVSPDVKAAGGLGAISHDKLVEMIEKNIDTLAKSKDSMAQEIADFEEKLKDPATQLQIGFNQLEETIGLAVLPILQELAPAISSFISSLDVKSINSFYDALKDFTVNLAEAFRNILLPILLNFAQVMINLLEMLPEKYGGIDEATGDKYKEALVKFSNMIDQSVIKGEDALSKTDTGQLNDITKKIIYGITGVDPGDIDIGKIFSPHRDPNNFKPYTKKGGGGELTSLSDYDTDIFDWLTSYSINDSIFGKNFGHDTNISNPSQDLKDAATELKDAATELKKSAPGSSDQPPTRPIFSLGSFNF